LAGVSGAFNAIYVSSDLAGDLLFYGQGAGMLPATSSVISDLVDLTKDIKAGLFRPTLQISLDPTIKRLRKFEEIRSRYYIRFMAIDKPGVLAKISGCLGRHNISIASVSQKERQRAKVVPIVMLTHEAVERDMCLALREIERLNVIKEKSVTIRMEEV
jgi:homoserine dehydrogenase